MPGPLEGRLAEGFGAEIMHARGLAHRGINNAQDRREWKGAAKVENKSRVVRDGGAALQREVGSGAAEGGQHNSKYFGHALPPSASLDGRAGNNYTASRVEQRQWARENCINNVILYIK